MVVKLLGHSPVRSFSWLQRGTDQNPHHSQIFQENDNCRESEIWVFNLKGSTAIICFFSPNYAEHASACPCIQAHLKNVYIRNSSHFPCQLLLTYFLDALKLQESGEIKRPASESAQRRDSMLWYWKASHLTTWAQQTGRRRRRRKASESFPKTT